MLEWVVKRKKTMWEVGLKDLPDDRKFFEGISFGLHMADVVCDTHLQNIWTDMLKAYNDNRLELHPIHDWGHLHKEIERVVNEYGQQR
jgi:hypothetical protein